MNPIIKMLPETKLVGIKKRMSFLNNQTGQLWKSFIPKKNEIQNSEGSELYSVEVYDSPAYFVSFDPAAEFEKWAAVKVEDFKDIPEGLDTIIIPTGLYAVFPFRGMASEATKMYQYIFGSWVPDSAYEIDNRPHFALMGEKYKNNDPNSEEELWIPIKPTSNE
ncbi:GyrI-like domain-containing protein [Algoriphagus sp. D3-2-R+10]|uniref:GyrI-like domain-containing protein n=1 Tax=Algoriphagus aurantiacus TaxID=3103948 RepID=UPI002B39E0F3|nr:GyrI-like domain-containing protein [Algoriphagus sp. D3-2-R+10]MEB2775272.1 GyrI-like domain-containing protein [Algoriphagus sp. D3-2-R+10]